MIGKLKWMGMVLLMCLFLCGTAVADGAVYVVQTERGVMLVDAQGQSIIDIGQYNMLYELAGLPQGIRRFVAEKTTEKMTGCALLNEQGEALTEFTYQSFECVGETIIFKRKDYCGVMDVDGNILIESLYTVLIPTGDGAYLGQKTNQYDELPDTVYRIAADGTEQVTGTRIISGMYGMSEGRSIALSSDNALYGYLDTEGGWAIPPKFEWADAFKDGYAIAASTNGIGMIDLQGKWVLTPKFHSLSRQGDSLIVATLDNTINLIHPQTLQTVASYRGNMLYATPTEGGMAIVMDGTRGIVVNEQGTELLVVENCTSISRWSGMDKQVIVTTGEFGTAGVRLYDIQGNAVSNAYQEIMPLGKVGNEMHYMFISFEAMRTEYSKGLSFWDEVPNTRECGVLSGDGSELFRIKADYITWLGNERILIEQDGKRMFADIQGNILREYGAEDVQ